MNTIVNYNISVSYTYSYNGEWSDKKYSYRIEDFNKMNEAFIQRFATQLVHPAVPENKMKHFAEVNYTKFELIEENENSNVYKYNVVEPCTE